MNPKSKPRLEARKPGRPVAEPQHGPKTSDLWFRVSAAEKDSYVRTAGGRKLSVWVRETLNREVQRRAQEKAALMTVI
jgi:hypothetical protein